MLQFRNLDTCAAYKQLHAVPPFPVNRFNAERVRDLVTTLAGGLTFHWATAPVDTEITTIFQKLAEEQEVVAKYRALASGEVMNTGENRRVLHHLLRGEVAGPVEVEGRDLGVGYREQVARFGAFAEAVISGTERGSTGKRFTTVVQIGIGGSDLGPRALYLALKEWVSVTDASRGLEARFISNVDPDDAAAVLQDIDFETTLFVVVSKSGTTQETRTNQQFIAELARTRKTPIDVARHTIAVTSQTSPMATGDGYRERFFIDDYIGGRYSATSAVGGVVLSLAFGPKIFSRILAGAHEGDMCALNEDVRKNGALLDALIGVYERNIMNLSATAVLPYSQALSRFPAHLQQLDMESNGKSVNRDGEAVSYETGPLVFGEPGTNGQHSFYQLLHQGTTIVPLQFIGFRQSQRGDDTVFEGSSSQTKLNANLAAQIVAFAQGRANENRNKHFAGGRPSTFIIGDQLTPEALGALLAHYENKVMFQGFLWNINSFDQEGVQLGKVLTTELLSGAANGELQEVFSHFV
jgi:glucose-6-phosphate isomerase